MGTGLQLQRQLARLASPANNARAMSHDAAKPLPEPVRPAERARNAPPPELPLPRFGLRQLLVFVALVCALMAAMFSSDGLVAMVLLLAALVVSLHIASTALGTRLRAHANEHQAWEAAHKPASEAAAATASVLPVEAPLYGRRSSLRWLPLLVATGAMVGLAAGAILLKTTIGQNTSTAGLVLGAISLGVLGGWLAFLGTSFWTILRQGWREAVAHQKQDEARRTLGR
jgi:hypothetical protein